MQQRKISGSDSRPRTKPTPPTCRDATLWKLSIHTEAAPLRVRVKSMPAYRCLLQVSADSCPNVGKQKPPLLYDRTDVSRHIAEQRGSCFSARPRAEDHLLIQEKPKLAASQ